MTYNASCPHVLSNILVSVLYFERGRSLAVSLALAAMPLLIAAQLLLRPPARVRTASPLMRVCLLEASCKGHQGPSAAPLSFSSTTSSIDDHVFILLTTQQCTPRANIIMCAV